MTSRDGRDRALSGGAVVILLFALVACELPASPEPSVFARPSASASAEATPSPAPSGHPDTSAGPGSVELRLLDPRYVPGAALSSASGQLLWSAGETWPSEVWRYIPGSPEPQRLFASPREESSITAIVASGSGYAFVELSQPTFGEGGWRIWFLSGAGVEPVELDRGRAKGAGFPPTIAMDDERIVWAAFDDVEGGAVSRIAVASLGALEDVRTLIEVPVRDRLLWFPTLNGDELWYAIIDPDTDATGGGDELHLETLDLANPGAPPVRFSGLANDFNPAVNDRFVAWKTAEPGDAALNWGTLHVLNRRTQEETTIPVPHANRPSIGDRYLAFEEITHSRLAVYDTLSGGLLNLAPAASSPGSYGGQSLSGRLLVFTTPGPDRAQIGWAVLPE